jgi:hypothetical protein
MALLNTSPDFVKGITFIQNIWGHPTQFGEWLTFFWTARRRVTGLSKLNEESQQENQMLREENIALQEQLRIRGAFTEREGALWKEGEKEPYCLGCWQEDNTRHFQMMKYGHEGEYYCLQCPRPWQTKRLS